jgi:E3 ubiquitin-protein transferase RMND5
MKELAKLEKLTARPTDSGNVPYVIDPLGPLLQSLHEAKAAVESGAVVEDTFTRLAQAVDERKKEVDDRQKEVYGSLSRLSKALDKVCAHYCLACGMQSRRHVCLIEIPLVSA